MALTIDELAEQVRSALGADDPGPFVELLDPDVTWGGPGDPNPGCRNRNQVVAWYNKARQAGVRSRVLDIEIMDDRLVVTTAVRGRDDDRPPDEEALRFQVMTVRLGRIAEIVGFDDKADALAYLTPFS